jgi:F1F0 ATPase subunit 2
MNNYSADLLQALLNLLIPIVAGIFIGMVFFYSLLRTVQKGTVSDHPLLWFIGGFVLRMSFALGGFYLIAQGQWQSILACLFGFILGRLLFNQIGLKPAKVNKQTELSKEMDSAFKS